jgi:hypothetical protein
MMELQTELSLLSDWLKFIEPNPNAILLLIGLCYFVFGVTRKKTP